MYMQNLAMREGAAEEAYMHVYSRISKSINECVSADEVYPAPPTNYN